MNINIKHDKLLKETSKKLDIEPSVLVNTLVDSLEFIPAGFDDISKKHSLLSAMITLFEKSRFTDSVLNEISAVLGKHDYLGIDDFDFDLDKRYFWFRIEMLNTEKRVDIASVNLWIDSDGAQIMVDRILEGILLDDKKIGMAKNETDDLYLDELEADDLEWKLEINSEPNNESDNTGFTSLELWIFAEEFSSIPPLVKLNDILGEFEKIVLKQ